jgi:hypothetical protein
MSNLVISSISTGLETDEEPFLLDNDAFPRLRNAYVWRKRILRRRGTSLLGRLQRTFATGGLSPLTPQNLGNTSGGGTFSGNIFIILSIAANQPNASIIPGSITITVGAQTFTEPTPQDGTLVGSLGGSGTINYSTGLLTLTGAAATTAVIISFGYYPDLPVMGLESYDVNITNFPRLVAFDTLYSYEINQGTSTFYDVTFYKGTGTPFTWHGQNYQQFWTASYEGAMWTTNGVPGFHFTTVIAIADQTAVTTLLVTLGRADLIVGDVLFFNEVQGAVVTNLNGRTGIITNAAAAPVYDVQFTDPVTVTTYTVNTGIAQLLNHSSNAVNQDGIKWYDGVQPYVATNGWVNFMPPLSTFDPVNNPHPDYLVGAQMVTPFKGRLVFLNVTIAQYVSFGVYNQVTYPNRIVYSQDGTPYYTVSGVSPNFEPILVPINQTADPDAWSANRAGRGGFLGAPITENMVNMGSNEDVLITAFESKQLKLIFTGDDNLPFIFQTINSELGAQSTFSVINLDAGVLSIGEYGLTLTSQVSTQRIDLKIPDQVFSIRSANFDDKRVTAVRDYRNEWVYFTYCPAAEDDAVDVFPSETLLYNYRDNTWAIFDESYTTYGTFRRSKNITWAQLGAKYGTWAGWNDPWNFGSTSARYPNVVGGNQQGFVMIRDSGTYEANSQYIQSITIAGFVIGSPNHQLDDNDFIEIFNAIGVTNVNGIIFKVQPIDRDSFTLLLDDIQLDNPPAGTYVGGGVYRRIARPQIQTKQFQIGWDQARKTRIGNQHFLFQSTTEGEVTVQLYMSQADNFPVNVPADAPYLISSDIVLTRPEPNIGNGYPPDPNQMWHRLTNSFIGDTVQLGITLSDDQMRNNAINSAEIELHAIAINLYPSAVIA